MTRRKILSLPALALGLLLTSAAVAAPAPRVIEISVTSEGYVPSEVKVKAGQPLTLVITRKTERTCATEIVVKDYGINTKLPLNKPVEVSFTPTKAGKVRYACGMNMIAGVLLVD
jgi:plastocyanin domain-containing protein